MVDLSNSMSKTKIKNARVLKHVLSETRNLTCHVDTLENAKDHTLRLNVATRSEATEKRHQKEVTPEKLSRGRKVQSQEVCQE